MFAKKIELKEPVEDDIKTMNAKAVVDCPFTTTNHYFCHDLCHGKHKIMIIFQSCHGKVMLIKIT